MTTDQTDEYNSPWNITIDLFLEEIRQIDDSAVPHPIQRALKSATTLEEIWRIYA